MAYLDITPTIDAPRARPYDFELWRGNLVHEPSRHTFHLDITPTIDALRARPSDFELRRGNLVHKPSRHTFRFDRWGSARVDAQCDCALLLISLEQSCDLKAAFDVWRNEYWRVIEINREFASHFRPSRFQRFYEALKAVLGLGDARSRA